MLGFFVVARCLACGFVRPGVVGDVGDVPVVGPQHADHAAHLGERADRGGLDRGEGFAGGGRVGGERPPAPAGLDHDDPDGVIGNEDCGQMSAWYIFSSLGFYPVFPASGDYVLGSPLFDKATIRLSEGKNLTVEVKNNSPENMYIQQVELNGKLQMHSTIHHQDIIKGGILKIVMGKQPNLKFGLENLNP